MSKKEIIKLILSHSAEYDRPGLESMDKENLMGIGRLIDVQSLLRGE